MRRLLAPLAIASALAFPAFAQDEVDPVPVQGSSGNDVLVGNVEAEEFFSGEGADAVHGGDGDDTIHGGSGADDLFGEEGNDTIIGNEGLDELSGGEGNDRIWAIARGDVSVEGRDRNGDEIDAGNGNDVVHARDGERDLISCGDGRDRVEADPIDRVGGDCENVSRRQVRFPRSRQRVDPYTGNRSRGCTHKEQPGAQKLELFFQRNWKGRSFGIESCRKIAGSRNWSLHAEGRALDWGLDASDRRELAAGDRFVNLVLQTRAGERNAMARRMGIQELIWNCRIWSSSSPTLRTYSYCARVRRNRDPSTAHQNHIHIGLSWRGAQAQTSFWESFLEDAPEG